MVCIVGKYFYQACPVNRIQAENVKVFLLNIHSEFQQLVCTMSYKLCLSVS